MTASKNFEATYDGSNAIAEADVGKRNGHIAVNGRGFGGLRRRRTHNRRGRVEEKRLCRAKAVPDRITTIGNSFYGIAQKIAKKNNGGL